MALDPDAQSGRRSPIFSRRSRGSGPPAKRSRCFASEGLRFPSRNRNQKQTIFQPLTISAAIRTLNNPRYAGAYVYGRRHYRRAADGKKVLRKRECNDWLACIPDAHPGYITWEQFQQTSKSSRPMAADTKPRGRRRRGRARPCCKGAQSAAVAAGISASAMPRGADGWRRGMSATAPMALCGEPNCQSIAGAPIDEAIGELVAADDDARRGRTGAGDPERDRSPARRSRSAAPSRRRTRSDRRRSRTAAVHARRSEQPSCRRTRSNANGTTSCARWPGRRRKESAAGRRTVLPSTTRSASGSSP